jgi:hypothetical protein
MNRPFPYEATLLAGLSELIQFGEDLISKNQTKAGVNPSDWESTC